MLCKATYGAGVENPLFHSCTLAQCVPDSISLSWRLRIEPYGANWAEERGATAASIMLSLNCSQYLHFSEPPPQNPVKNKKVSLGNLHVSISKKNSSNGSSRYLRNGKWVPCGERFRAKSVDSETDTNTTTRSSQESPGVSDNGGNPSTSFLSLLCPLLRLFSGGDPSQERNSFLEDRLCRVCEQGFLKVATSSLSTLARYPWGSRPLSSSLGSQQITTEDSQKMPLQLYEFEACPFCRRVREALTELDLSVEVYPCPKGSLRHRAVVKTFGGKEQFPFLVDPNTGISMYESGEIVKYLFQQYGRGRNPSFGLLESTMFTGWIPTVLRAGRGMMLWEKARKDPPPRKLELFSYENNPYARIVREALCELELPYILQNVGEGSSKCELLVESSGSKEVPYFIDPNTGVRIGDYEKILSYLFQTYSSV